MKRKKIPKEGQGSTEYLVVFAVVLIIALVSIGLLGFYPGMAKDAAKTESDTYWQVSAYPLRIIDSAYYSGTACNASNSSAYHFVVKNAETHEVELKGISLNGQAGIFCSAAANASADQLTIGPFESSAIDVIIPSSVAVPCANGRVASVAITFTYGTSNINFLTQKGDKDLMITCPAPATSGSGGGGGSGGGTSNVTMCNGTTFGSCAGPRQSCYIFSVCPATYACSVHFTSPAFRCCHTDEACGSDDWCCSGSCVSGTCQG